ncbi:MAG: 4Fe-4S binding protein [bacterium]|nr:MAG: 4Fe-4S binding protein [bacterium]
MEKTIILKFTKQTWRKPIIYGLSKNFDLVFNILEAKVLPRQEAYAIMSLEGPDEEYYKGIEYLKECNVIVEEVPEQIQRDEDSCTHCGTCTAVCPTDALFVDGDEKWVRLDTEKCVACGNCVQVCTVQCISLFVI